MAASQQDCSLEPAACCQLERAVARASSGLCAQCWERQVRRVGRDGLGFPGSQTQGYWGSQKHDVHQEVLLSEGKSPCLGVQRHRLWFWLPLTSMGAPRGPR